MVRNRFRENKVKSIHKKTIKYINVLIKSVQLIIDQHLDQTHVKTPSRK